MKTITIAHGKAKETKVLLRGLLCHLARTQTAAILQLLGIRETDNDYGCL